MRGIIGRKTAIVAALLATTSIAAAEDVEVLHWWTSGGESAALNVLKDDLATKTIGWVDMPVAGGGGEAHRRRGALNVAIRTFWFSDGEVRFGTGGGITWDSDPAGEWEETELKARRLLAVAAGPDPAATSA